MNMSQPLVQVSDGSRSKRLGLDRKATSLKLHRFPHIARERARLDGPRVRGARWSIELVLVTRAACGEPPVGEPLCASTERRTSRGGARRREGGKCGPREERGSQVPLYLESPEAEYIPTYLPSTCPLSLSHFCCLSLFFFPSRPIASLLPLPTLEFSSSLGPVRAIPLEVHAMMHATEQQRGPTSDLLHLADDARRDVDPLFLFFSFFLFLSPLTSPLCAQSRREFILLNLQSLVFEEIPRSFKLM